MSYGVMVLGERSTRFARFAVMTVVTACGARTEVGVIYGLDAQPAFDAPNEVDGVVDSASPADGGGCFDGDAGTMTCGDAWCNANLDYCGLTIGGPDPGVSIYKCAPLNVSCHDCAYLQLAAPCVCSEDAGQIMVTCPVP